MNVNSICCKTFVPTEDMLGRFNSKEMYHNKNANNNNDEENTEYENFDSILDMCA